MTRILTLDASMATCSAGLVADDTVLGERRSQDELAALPAMVDALFTAHGREIDLVAVVIGPGSFTGLRASIALAHGIGLAADVDVVGVTVGAALTPESGSCWAAVDSKRGRVFLERDGRVESVSLDALPLPETSIALGGDAALMVGEALAFQGADVMLLPSLLPDPLGIARAARRGTGRPALPLYIEPPAARPGPPGRPAPA